MRVKTSACAKYEVDPSMVMWSAQPCHTYMFLSCGIIDDLYFLNNYLRTSIIHVVFHVITKSRYILHNLIMKYFIRTLGTMNCAKKSKIIIKRYICYSCPTLHGNDIQYTSNQVVLTSLKPTTS